MKRPRQDEAKMDAICAFGFDTRCLECAIKKCGNGDDCSYTDSRRDDLPTEALPFVKVAVTPCEDDAMPFRSIELLGKKCGSLTVKFEDCIFLRTRVHKSFKVASSTPSFLMLALHIEFMREIVKAGHLGANTLPKQITTSSKKDDTKPAINLIIRFKDTHNEFLDNIERFCSSNIKPRINASHLPEKYQLQEYVNYANPGKLRQLLKYYLSPELYPTISRYPEPYFEDLSQHENIIAPPDGFGDALNTLSDKPARVPIHQKQRTDGRTRRHGPMFGAMNNNTTSDDESDGDYMPSGKRKKRLTKRSKTMKHASRNIVSVERPAEEPQIPEPKPQEHLDKSNAEETALALADL